MKKIAMITEGWVRNCSDAWIFGALSELKTTATDANMFIFSTNGHWSDDREYNRGEYNLYRLPDFTTFDGIILDINNISEPEVAKELEDMVRASKVPFVVIAGEIEGGYYSGIDNKKAFRMMLEHLYNVHQSRTYWFITGPEVNYENDTRELAVKEFLMDKQISVDSCGFFHRDFDYECGIDGFRTLYQEKNHEIPDAIVCVNDNIAVGVLLEAKKYGLTAPDDFLITGFDDFDKARYYQPRITTVSQNRFETGVKCIDVLRSCWNGKVLDQFQYNPFEMKYWESCGCNGFDLNGVRLEEYMRGQIQYGLESHSFENKLLTIESALMMCDTVRDMLFVLDEYVSWFECNGFYIVAIPEVLNVEAMSLETTGSMDAFPKKGYPDNMRLIYSYEREGYESFLHRGMTVSPEIFYDLEQESGCNTLYSAIHFNEHTIGYFVIRDASYLMEKQFLFLVFNTLRSGMQTLYHKEVQFHMNQWLTELYVRDSMTMLYNRYGLAQFGKNLYDKAIGEEENLTFIYIDMDCLKQTNDTYGHEMGDVSILIIADAIKKNLSKIGLGFRLGGDEFLLIDHASTDEEADLLCKRVQDSIDEAVSEKELPFEISISSGYVHSDYTKNMEFEKYMDEADAIMYENKQRRKAMKKAQQANQ